MPPKLKEGNWIMFQNVKKKDTHPDYRGEINFDGEILELVGWVKVDDNGDQFLSGSWNPKKIGNL